MANKPLIRRPTALKDVPLGKTMVLEIAQRRRDPAWVEHLLSEFDLDQIGFPIVSQRDGKFWIIDGQHRIEALKRFLGDGWERQIIQCKTYSGLSAQQEAELFLRYNDVRQVRTFDKFMVGVTAERHDEVAIKRIVEAQGLHISASKNQSGGISAVGVLKRLHSRSDEATLAKTLRIVRDAYGDTGLEAVVIDGIGHLCKRYNGALDEQVAKNKLGAARGGVKGLVNRAAELKLRTGNSMPICVAAAAVDIINSGRGGAKLASWWSE